MSVSPFAYYLAEYLALERRFKVFCEYIPLVEKHFDVWSPVLASIIETTCSIIDSFFKTILEISEGRIDEYRKEMEPKYRLGEKRIFLLSIYKEVKRRYKIEKEFVPIYPFESWIKEETMFWWHNYNDIKHNRHINREKATVKTTIYALGGLFLLLVSTPQSAVEVVKQGLVKGLNGMPKGDDQTIRRWLGLEKWDSNMAVNPTAQSSFFAYRYPSTSGYVLNDGTSKYHTPLDQVIEY